MVNELALRYPERAAGLIFIGAPLPQQGGNVASACTIEVRAGFQAAYEAGIQILPTPSREQAAAVFGNDMDDAIITRMHGHLVQESLGVFFEQLDLSGLRRGIPSLYIKLTRDAASPPEIQDNAIAAIRPDSVRQIACGHMAMYNRPAELAAAIDDWLDSLMDAA